jgi:predicted ArsR family transcriptional regulator
LLAPYCDAASGVRRDKLCATATCPFVMMVPKPSLCSTKRGWQARSLKGRYPLSFDKSAGILVVSKRKGKAMRLERRGWIKARWSTSENNRRAKYYELTRRGRAELETQTTAWHKLAATVGQVLETA